MLALARTSVLLAAAALAAAAPAGVAAQARDTSFLVNEAAVAAALRSPEALWAFVTSPRTRWADRTAASFRASPASRRSPRLDFDLEPTGMVVYGPAPAPPRFVLPLSYLPRVTGALRELRRERALHNWGWRFRAPSAWDHPSDTVAPPPFTGSRRRTILGHPWTVPEGEGLRPEGFGEDRAGPWPANVETSLGILFNGFADPEHAVEFYAAVARLPCEDLAEAAWLTTKTEALARNARVVTADVVGLWRNMALHPTWEPRPSWAEGVLAWLALTPGEDAFWLEQALSVELVTHADMGRLRRLVELRWWLVPDPANTVVRPALPHVTRLAVARRVDALPDSVPAARRAAIASFVLRNLDPAAADAFPPETSDAAEREAALAVYRAWFARNEPALARLAATQEARVAAARQAIHAVTTCRGAR